MNINEKCINTIRCLAMDAVQKANSGHPGTPMALAPAAFTLWMKHLRFNPKNPHWFNRDRFILSNGHASLLQYSILYLCGYDISLDDIKDFRQWHSNTPGHPEHRLTPGIETTTGPLGQGLIASVGMAMAEAHLAAIFNKEIILIDHFTYVFCSDGDLMEGASHEAASLAGHLGLGKLIWLFDNNNITIEGEASLSCSDDVAKRFEGYHWHVQELTNGGNDTEAISIAFETAKEVKDKPSIIILKTHIGYGSPKQDSPKAHGSPLGEEDIKLTKEFYGWPEDTKFLVPEDVKMHMNTMIDKGIQLEKDWKAVYESYRNQYPALSKQLENYLGQNLPEDWDKDVPNYSPKDGPKATREVNGDFINAIADQVPWLIGGSGDLEPSTLTLIKNSGYLNKTNYKNRNIAYGIREHLMCGASSGLALHGGVRPFAATFFIFTDYARPAIRLACIMEIPVIYIMTHDSIGLGEDGTTHQPIEHLASFRAMPNMCVIRPADANETAYAWRYAIKRKNGPTLLVLTRQKLPIFDRKIVASAEGTMKGAYVLSPEKGNEPKVILIATGSEVQLILESQQKLLEENIDARVISMPSWEIFRKQPPTYRDSVLAPTCKLRLAVEAGAIQGWEEWVGERGDVMGISIFGTSAPAKEIFKHYGFTTENIVRKTIKMINRQS
jgi:transketolase